jgi:YtoQ family protein
VRSTRTGASGSSTARAPQVSTSPSPAPSPTTPPATTAGAAILGAPPERFWHDHVGAGVNAIRTRSLLEHADVVVVRFGEQYRQWNAAFDAGYAAALGKPLVTLHPPEHDHALKEVDRAALAVAREPEQVVDLLRYVIEGALPAR